MHLLGFRVEATLPGEIDRARDDFVLEQAARECAQRARAAGAINVQLFQVTQWRGDGWREDEELAPLEVFP